MNPALAVERDERRREPKVCMNHQDLAKALDLPDPKPYPKWARAIGWRPGNPETGEGRGYPLEYFGAACPLCHPEVVYGPMGPMKAHDARMMRRGSWDDGFGS